MAVLGGGLYWPTQGFALDDDVRTACGMDKGQVLVNVDLLFHPRFEREGAGGDRDVHALRGHRRREAPVRQGHGCHPHGGGEPHQGLGHLEQAQGRSGCPPKDVKGRFPPHWPQLLAKYRNRDYPLVLGGYPHGYFGTLAHLMGYEHLFYNYTRRARAYPRHPEDLHRVWIAVYEEVLSQTDVDLFVIWEDISAGTGSMVAPAMIREFMLPYYKRLTGFLKAHGVKTIFVDTDGECTDLIPLFLEGGVTGLYPMEASCGVDIVKVRKLYPRLQLMGGIPKSEIVEGARTHRGDPRPGAEVLKTGGYVPFGDHLIPPEVHWAEFSFYRRRLNELIDNRG